MAEYLEISESSLSKPERYRPQVVWTVSVEEIRNYSTAIVACDEYSSIICSSMVQSLPNIIELGKIEADPKTSNSKVNTKKVLYGAVYGIPSHNILLVSFHARSCNEQDSFGFLSSLLFEDVITDVLTLRGDVHRGKNQMWRVNTPSTRSMTTTGQKLCQQFDSFVPQLPIGMIINLLPAAITSYCEYRQIDSVLLSLSIDDYDLASTGRALQQVLNTIETYLHTRVPVGETEETERSKLKAVSELKEFGQWSYSLSSNMRHLYT